MTSRSWATISVDPSAVIAGDETATATLHIADSRAGSTDTAWVHRTTGGRGRRDSGDERDEAEDDGTHSVRLFGSDLTCLTLNGFELEEMMSWVWLMQNKRNFMALYTCFSRG